MLVLGALLGVFVTLMAAGAILFIQARDTTPVLSSTSLKEARARWQADGPASYDLDLVVGGNRPGNIHVQVRSGQVTALTRDGRTPPQRRTWQYWSVPGQFEMLDDEIENAAEPERHYQVPAGSQVLLRAAFDPRLGYPLKFSRVVVDKPLNVSWETVGFEAVSP